MLRRMLVATGMALAITATSLVAGAEELRVAPAAPPAHPANGTLYTKLIEFLPEESDGRLTAKMFGPEVVNLTGMKDALQNQVVQVGNLLPLYFPSDLPNTAIAGDLALLGRNPHAMGAAITEYAVTCPDCQAEFKKFGIVYVGSGSSDVYVLMTTKPVHTVADLKGMRLRSGGAPYSRWAEAVGATPVNISVFDAFEAMSQGTIDGTMASIFDLVSFRLIELVKHVTDLDLGTYHTTVNFAVVTDLWKSLSVEDRKAFVRAANRANALFTERWGFESPAIANQQAEEAGIEFIEPDPELVAFTESFIESDVDTAAQIATEKFNVTDAAAKIERFRELVEKWTKIAEENDNDPVKIAEAVQREVWDKIDYETYGL